MTLYNGREIGIRRRESRKKVEIAQGKKTSSEAYKLKYQVWGFQIMGVSYKNKSRLR